MQMAGPLVPPELDVAHFGNIIKFVHRLGSRHLSCRLGRDARSVSSDSDTGEACLSVAANSMLLAIRGEVCFQYPLPRGRTTTKRKKERSKS